MSDELRVQCKLVHRSDSGQEVLWSWLPVRPGLNVGARVTLKDHEHPAWLWDVEVVGQPQPEKRIKRGWKNNI